MNNTINYLFEVSIVFALFYSLYYLVFRNLTFHNTNRVILLFIIPVSFILPIIELQLNSPLIEEFTLPAFQEFIAETSNTITANTIIEGKSQSINYSIYIYGIGVLFFVGRLVLNAIKLLNLKRKSNSLSDNGISINKANIHSTFSCFKWIFVPSKKSREEDSVLTHEKAHTLLGHTYDLILTEIVIALLWFNPFVFFFRKSIKSVHEFQADHYVIKNNQVLKSDYLALILQKLEQKSLVGIYSYFNCITIKNRVKMITKDKSNKKQIFKYFLILPIIVILLMGFTEDKSSWTILENDEMILKKSNIGWTVKPQEKKEKVEIKEKAALPQIKEIPEEAELNEIPIKNGKPILSPINEGEMFYSANFGKKMISPITKKEKIHTGIDIIAEEGTLVNATLDGIIIEQKFDKGWGNYIAIKHKNGYTTFYAHLRGFNLKKGDKVKMGDLIGFVGNTGISTGSHLHYEVRLNGKPINPHPIKIKLLNGHKVILPHTKYGLKTK